MMWRVILDLRRSTEEQMAYDERLADAAVPAVRMFVWSRPGISLGWKQSPPAWIEPSRWRASGLGLVERPTGGGVAFHGSDVSVAVIVPRRIGLRVETVMTAICGATVTLCQAYGVQASSPAEIAAQERITYCLTEPSPYGVFADGRPSAHPAYGGLAQDDPGRGIASKGRKLAGFALRRYPESWLVQGSLLVQPLPRVLSEALPEELARRLETQAMALSERADSPVDPSGVATRWAESWASWWAASLPQRRKRSASAQSQKRKKNPLQLSGDTAKPQNFASLRDFAILR